MFSIYVDYQLSEYIKILKEFVPILLARENKKSGKNTKGIKWYQLILLYMIAPPAFFYKKLRVGNCTFEFDSIGIERQSKTGKQK